LHPSSVAFRLSSKDREELRSKKNILEERIISEIRSNKYPTAAAIILEHTSIVDEYLEKILPAESVALNRNKYQAGFPHSDIYPNDSAEERERKMFLKQFTNEEKLSDAKHPKHIMKVWAANKNIFEERYHITFDDPVELLQMNYVFDMEQEFLDWISECRLDAKQYHGIMNSKKIREKYGEAFQKELSTLLLDSHFKATTRNSAIFLLGMLDRIEDPQSITRLKIEQEGEEAHLADLDYDFCWYDVTPEARNINGKKKPHEGDNFLYDEYKDKIAILKTALRLKNDTLTFRDAICIAHYDFCNDNKIILRQEPTPLRMDLDKEELPEKYLKQVKKRIVDDFKKPSEDPFTRKVQQFFVTYALDRWAATAVDYEKIFMYHELGFEDVHIVEKYYELLGKEVSKHSPEIEIGRIPGVLRSLITQGLLQPEDITPPLKKKYLTPEESVLFQAGKQLTPQLQEQLSTLKISQTLPILKCMGSIQRLLPESTTAIRQLIPQTSTTKNDYWDPTKTYFFLGKGNHTAFFTEETYYPNGEQALGDIYRFAIVQEGASVDGIIVPLPSGEQLHIKKQAGMGVRDHARSIIHNNDHDATPLQSFSAITDVPADEFMQKYFTDFMIHIAVHQHNGFEWTKRVIDKIQKWTDHKQVIFGGSSNRVTTYTFDIGGKFAFHIEYDKDRSQDTDIFIIAQAVTTYLQECGISYRYEDNLDEQGRKAFQKKLEERVFYAEHIATARSDIEKMNLANIIIGLWDRKDTDINTLGVSKEHCKICQQPHITGSIRYSSDGQYDQLYFTELHDFAAHPEQYIQREKGFRKIVKILEDTKPYTPKLAVTPNIEIEFITFIDAYAKYKNARNKCSEFSEWTQGAASIRDPVELENNPELKKLYETSIELKQERDTADKLFKEKLTALNTAYTRATGAAAKDHNSWAEETLKIRILEVYNPQALVEISASVTAINILEWGYWGKNPT